MPDDVARRLKNLEEKMDEVLKAVYGMEGRFVTWLALGKLAIILIAVAALFFGVVT